MNVTLEDLMSNQTRPAACSIMNDNIHKKINDNLYYDTDDVFDRNPTNRQFYTTPITTIPNDQTTFAKWLNDIPATCKEDQRYCLRYEDIRFIDIILILKKRFLMIYPVGAEPKLWLPN